MSDETMVAEDGIRVGLVGFDIWASAMELIRGGELPHVDEDLFSAWEAVGIITPRGLATDWQRALAVAQNATAGMELVSVYREVAFNAMVFALGDDLVTVTSRAAVTEGESGWQATGVDPMLEVAMGPSSDPWRLLRRTLPPLDLARAKPRLPRAEEMRPVTVDANIPKGWAYEPELFGQRLLQLPTLAPQVRDALDPEASIFAHTVRETRSGVAASSDAWAVGQNLYHLVPGQAGIMQVPAGQLGAQLVLRLSSGNR